MIQKLSFFADENIQESLIIWLKENNFKVSGIRLENLHGLDDESIIEKAFIEKKVILTQDSDFGKIVFTRNIKF
jgi:predicted nuclease of predicted toxin-antitoxin system